MSSVYDEITRLKTAKEDIETAIETCGVNVPDTSLISTYASYIRQIPAAIFSDLNVDISGGAGSYIESIEQEDGKIVTTTGGTVSTSKSGLAPQIGTSAAATIGTQADEWVLTSTKGGAPTWRKLPVGAFKTNKTLKFKNTSNTEVSYDGSTAIDLTGGIHYANTAANISGGAAGSIPYQTAAGTTAFLAKGTSGQVLKMNSSGIPYWTTDNNSNTWRNIQVNSTQIASTGTNTYALNFVSGTGITAVGTAGSASAANTITFNINASKTDTLGGIKVAKVGTSAITLLEDGSKYYGVNIDSNNKAYVALPAFTANTGTVTSVTLKAGNGISISSTAAITTNGERTITNTGVRSTTINGNYLRVNTNGTNTDLTIPFATTAKEAKSLTSYRDHIKITEDNSNTDNPLTWSNVGTSIHMYSVHNSLYGQPSQFGLLLSLAYGQDIHQIWAAQSSGNLYHRGGHSGGWANISDNNAWRTILDNVNSSVSGDGGSTWGSSITVKINNVSKTLTIPANPNTDTKVAYTAATSNVAHPILFANNSTNTGNPTTGAVYYESNATSGAGLTYNPYSNLLNIPNGKLQINTTVKDHGNTAEQCLYIYAPDPGTTTITTKNSPGIGFKVEGNNWGSIVFNQGVFEFAKNDFVNYHNIRANILMSTVATGTAPLRINSTTLVSNLNADMLDNLHATDFYKKTDTIDADTLGGHPAEDFFLNTDLLEGFSIEDLTVEAIVRVSRSYYYNISGVGIQTVYNTSGNGLTNPVSNSLIKPIQIGLKGPIIRVISVTKTGNASTYTANIGEQYITVNFSGTSVANTGDSFEFTLLLPAFNNS